VTGSVIVAAPYPTMGGPASAATLALVRRLLADGHDVTVVSPRASAAHHHADPVSPRGVARLAGLVAGCDRLVIRLDAQSLAAGTDAPKLLPARLALSAAFRRVPQVDLILDRVPNVLARRWVALVAGRASTVTVATPAEQAALVAAGIDPAKVLVDPEIVPPAPERVLQVMAAGPGSTDSAVEPSAGAIEELVRRRAVESLSPAEAGSGPGQPSAASKPLRAIAPLERPHIRSRNPGYVTVKRAQLKLLSWMFDSVIQHVNRLHQATIEAIDLSEKHPPRR
jgi:hypothetical protein